MINEEISEIQAYKHLLEVAESIIRSVKVEPQILEKYEHLKNVTMIRIQSANSVQQLFQKKLTQAYKSLCNHALTVITSFESEIESEMQRAKFNAVVSDSNQEFSQVITELADVSQQGERHSTKVKLVQKEQLSALKYFYDQLDGKFENMGLMIQVHRKMHEIICQASKNEAQKLAYEHEYRSKLKEVDRKLGQLASAKQFIELSKLTREELAKYHLLSKKFNQILFEQ